MVDLYRTPHKCLLVIDKPNMGSAFGMINCISSLYLLIPYWQNVTLTEAAMSIVTINNLTYCLSVLIGRSSGRANVVGDSCSAIQMLCFLQRFWSIDVRSVIHYAWVTFIKKCKKQVIKGDIFIAFSVCFIGMIGGNIIMGSCSKIIVDNKNRSSNLCCCQQFDLRLGLGFGFCLLQFANYQARLAHLI